MTNTTKRWIALVVFCSALVALYFILGEKGYTVMLVILGAARLGDIANDYVTRRWPKG